MYTFAPLPSWTGLLSAIHSTHPTDANLAAPWLQNRKFVSWFSRSAWAMKTIALWWAQSHDAQPPNVWLPDYFCNQSADLLRETGAKLTFYPIKPNLEPDWEACQKLISNGSSPDLFFLVHYFGHALDGAQALSFCRQNDTLLVEDAAHVLTPVNGIGTWGDFVFFSQHKLIPTPDGALLLAQTSQTLPNKEFLANAAPRNPSSSHWAWMTKRALQKLMPEWVLRSRVRHLPGFDFDQQPTATTSSAEISQIGQRLIHKSCNNLTARAEQRKAAANGWREAFNARDDNCTPFFSEEAEGAAPYRFVLQCPDKQAASARFTALRKIGIAVETWPDLPPEVMAKPSQHETALELRHTLLFLPVHNQSQPDVAHLIDG